MHIDAIKEFYASLTMVHYKKKEVARSRVRGVEIEFDSMRLASILGIPGNNDIFEYIKEVWEESKYNDNMITTTRRGESGSDDQFYDAQVEVEEPAAEAPAVPVFPASPGDSTTVQKEPATAGFEPSISTGNIPNSVVLKL
ncbi:hypothetical protein Dimus_005884 [Dionaea muscipula]